MLVITDLFVQLFRTAPLLNILADEIAKTVLDNRMLLYGPSKLLLSKIWCQSTFTFFQLICQTLGVAGLFTMTNRPQCKEQVKRFNITFVEALRYYVANDPME